MKADAAGILFTPDQGDFQPQISSHKRCGITARTGADHCQLHRVCVAGHFEFSSQYE